MNEGQTNQNNLVDTTDCLEARGVFKGWKNTFFTLLILSMLLLQAAFWVVDLGLVATEEKAQCPETAAAIEEAEQTQAEVPEASKQVKAEAVETLKQADVIKQAAEKVAAEPNQPAAAAEQQTSKSIKFAFKLKTGHVRGLVRFLNFITIPLAALYCLTMLFCLKVSLLGRLGGISHISRAFFLSLLFFVFLMPWQVAFKGPVLGAMYMPSELLDSCGAKAGNIFCTALYYLRFTGYWLLVLLLLIFAQLRSYRWAKTTLRRLEVI
jgi:ABC-type multidrug transport system fused ATPase/permease subunit